MLISKKKYLEALDRIKNLEEQLKNCSDEKKIIKVEIQLKDEKLLELTNTCAIMEDERNDLKKNLNEMTENTKIHKENIIKLSVQLKTLNSHKNIYEEFIREFETQKEKKQTLINEIKELEEQYENKAKNELDEIAKLLLEKKDELELDILNYQTKLLKLKQDSFEYPSIELKLKEAKETLLKIEENIINAKEEKKLQDVAFYKNVIPFTTTLEFKEKLFSNNEKQKEMLKKNEAVNSETTWTVNGSVKAGRALTKENTKFMIRSFNTECDNAIRSLKFSNYESLLNRIEKAYQQINKLNKRSDLNIKEEFLNLKLEELRLIYELKIFEQKEKEKLQQLRQDERERKLVEKEIKEKLIELDKHEDKMEGILSQKMRAFSNSKGENKELLNEIKEIEDNIELVRKKREEVHQRHQVGKSGYVYVISNVGSFGANIYKIGMTRRLEPNDRIRELNGAAVPFPYDIHTMILTDDAPKLENQLHAAFNDKRLNLVNKRKEFFNVSIEEIKDEIIRCHGEEVIFEENGLGEQFYLSDSFRINMLEEMQDNIFVN